MSTTVSPAFSPAQPVSQQIIDQTAAWLELGPRGFMPPASDRSAWNAAGLDRARILKDATEVMDLPVPALSDDLYLDFMRSGLREPFTCPYEDRIWRAERLALAECVEFQGRFLPALRDLLTLILVEKTWVYPMHDGPVGYTAFRGECAYIDLGAAVRAANLAAIGVWLGEPLGEPLWARIRSEIDRRIVQPYLRYVFDGQSAPGWWWVTATTNWNSVCHAGTVYATLAVVEDVETRARVVAATAENTARYFQGFTPDGYISEGMGYWGYGYGHFVILAETLLRATGGRLDLYRQHADKAAAVASYPLRVRLSESCYPAFSDCGFGARPDPSILRLLSRRVELPDSEIDLSARYTGVNAYHQDLDLAPPPESQPRLGVPEFSTRRGYFREAGVLVCHPSPGQPGIAAAMKGGHNEEMHNHNDVGSYTVVIDDQPVLADPGMEIYTKRTFSGRRYNSPALNSYGHPVPVIDGQLQSVGRSAAAIVLEADFTDLADRFVIDMTAAYHVEGLQSVRRTFQFERSGRTSLKITDEFVLTTSRNVGTALITPGEFRQLEPAFVRISYQGAALLAKIDVQGLRFDLSDETLDANLPYGYKARRLGVNLPEPVTYARIIVEITPDI